MSARAFKGETTIPDESTYSQGDEYTTGFHTKSGKSEVETEEERDKERDIKRDIKRDIERDKDRDGQGIEKENGSIMQALREYEEFQKKNMHYGKKNPYKKKTNKLNNMKHQVVRLFSSYNLETFERIKTKETNGHTLLTSRAAMWSEAEKHDSPDFDVKLTSLKKKNSIIDNILNQMNILINYTGSETLKKGRTYFASFMILLSILITLISSFRNGILYKEGNSIAIKSAKTPFGRQNFTVNNNNNYDQLNRFLEYIQLGKETNAKQTIVEVLDQWKKHIEKTKDIITEKVTGGDSDKTGLYYESGDTNTSFTKTEESIDSTEQRGTDMKKADMKIVKIINEELKKKINELEKRLIEHTKEIHIFKNNSLKEIEQLKQKMKEELYDIKSQYDSYIRAEEKQLEPQKKNKDNNVINALETKLNKSEIEFKETIASNVENTKKELLQIISDMQKKIEDVERELFVISNTDYSTNNTSSKKKKGKFESSNNTAEEQETKEEEMNYTINGEEAKEKKKKFSFWEKKEVSLSDIQKELKEVKYDTQKSMNFINKIFPSFEEKIEKQLENKMKNYLETYKKEVLKEFAKNKLDKAENYKVVTKQHEKLQKELTKFINEQIHIQMKNIKEEFHKFILSLIERKNPQYEKNELTDWGQKNLSAVEILQKKVDELYNEFILDYDQIDWALESLGAKIVYKMTSSPLNKNDWIEKFLNSIISLLPSEEIYGLVKPIGKDPSIILKPHNFPGDCFSFKGKKGKITIHLPATIDISSISIQHVHEHISNNPNATPKYFSVYGIVDTNWPEYFEPEDINYNDIKNVSLYNCLHSVYGNLPAKDILDMWIRDGKQPTIISLGDFYFDRKKRIANFVTKHCFPIKRVVFEFTENYGANYTCVYRVKVHGKRCIRKMK